jgi:hypothetical protein
MTTANATTTQAKATWNGWLQTYPDPSNPTRMGVATSIYGASVPELIADIYKTATYYHACGYRCVAEGLELTCDRCHGNGDIPRSRGDVRKRCPDCKGKGILDRMPDIELKVSDNVKINLA